MDIKKKYYPMLKWAKELFPFCRSITGNGTRKTLQYFKKLNPEFRKIEFKTGQKVFDWVIPKEWNIKDAYIQHVSGKKFADFKKCNLHVVGYSKPINKILTKEELYKIIDQQFLILLNASRPFSKFQRFDFALSSNYWSRHKEIFTHEDLRSNMQYEDSEYRAIFDAKYIWDNTRWAYTYPNDGSRFYVKYKTSPIQPDKVGSITFDGRFYKSFSNGMSTLFRSFIGLGFPGTSDQFYLGSTPSLWNSDNYNPLEYYNINDADFYFSEYFIQIFSSLI